MNIVPSELSRDPFKALFLEFLESFNVADIPSKTQCLQDFTQQLEELESHTENESTFLHWAGIGCGFCTCLTLAGAATLNPLLGGLVYALSAGSAIGVFGMTLKQNQDRRPVLEKLRRYRIALKSDNALNWACLWEYARTDIFLGSLYQASGGYLRDNRTLIRNDGKNPMAAALDSCCQYYGISREELIDQLKQLKAGVAVKIPTVPKALEPVAHSEKRAMLTPNYHQNALDILGGLVEGANKSKLGGCVILAAPGGGKTTFLGAAWGRLKSIYGDRFKSLAVVVKASDLEAFKGCSDQAICVKDSPVKAAIAIIKFIAEGMKHQDQVRRLFLDDFLTMNQHFEASLGGLFINPGTYHVYMDRKECKEAGDFDAIPLYKCLFTSLNELWLVGREFNSGLYVSSHSPNVDALPFVGSRDSRSVGDLIFLAKDNKREFIDQALNNPNLIADNQKRQQLKEELNSKISQNNEPWVLANFNNWTLGIVPSDVYEEYQSYRAEWQEAKATRVIKDQLEKLFNVETKGENAQDTLKVSPSLSPDAQLVLSYFDNAKAKTPKSVKDLKDANKLRTLNQSQLMKALSQLIAAEILDIDEEGNYLKVDW